MVNCDREKLIYPTALERDHLHAELIAVVAALDEIAEQADQNAAKDPSPHAKQAWMAHSLAVRSVRDTITAAKTD